MKTTQVNRIMAVAGSLLLAALITYLFKGNQTVLNALRITASVVAGYPIFLKAWGATRSKMFSIDLLVIIATIGALIIGEYTEAAAVTFLFLFGAFLEARSLKKARASLKSLMEMAPLRATVLRQGNRVVMKAEEVVQDDVVIIQTGEKIPVDGRVVSGQAYVNEAAITGESVPVNKSTDAQVFSGSILDNGYLEVIAENVGEETTFSKIVELVEEAQEGKAKTQKFLEKFAKYYTPAVVILSAIMGLVSMDIHLSLTFLVIACPGALVISAPVSLVAGIGNAARSGILIKGGEVMEKLAKLNAVVFDKTGTLTKGKPAVTGIKAFGMTDTELLLKAAEAEMVSEHHLGRAIVSEAKNRGLTPARKPTRTKILKGRGITVEIGGSELFIGNRKGLRQNNIPLHKNAESFALQQEKEGNTAVFVADKNAVLGIISIADEVREEAPATVQKLKSDGLQHLVMLTGDNKHTAGKVAARLKMDEVFADLLPEDKAKKVKACMSKNINLAMVGDGVNDAPAMATADVGIAMGGAGTDIALETADVILMADKLEKLTYALNLSKATIRNMKQNMFFAVGTVSVLLAGVLTSNVNLASGMFIHELSVLLVILNAIRLTRYKPTKTAPFYRSKTDTEVRCTQKCAA